MGGPLPIPWREMWEFVCAIPFLDQLDREEWMQMLEAQEDVYLTFLAEEARKKKA